ncbi:MAG: lactate racemase domain-containing protein, partial [Acidobacteria bacterium]|nr:lactate racemase domain-containing protein [Acidobacteriota bacterium]
MPYGKATLEFSLPAGMRATVAVSNPVSPLEDERGAVAEALAQPIGTPRLREMARRGHRVCIVFTDATRVCPDGLLVPALVS